MIGEIEYGVKKWMKCQKNLRSVFRDLRLPLGNDMEHGKDLFWEILTEILEQQLKNVFRRVKNTSI